MSHACHRFWKCYKSLTFCSLLKRCTIPSACRAKRHLNVQKCSVPVSFSPHHCVGFIFFAWIPPLPVPAAPAAPSSQITPHSSNHTSLNSSQLPITDSSTHHSSHVSTHHSSTSRHQLITAFLVAGAVHRASWTSCGAHGRRWAAAAFRVAGAVHRASWTSCGARGRRWAAAAFRVAGAVHRASWSNCGARGRRWAAASFHTTHHSFTYHITTSHHNSSQLLTYQLITAPLLTPHPSQLHCSSQLITAPLLTGPLLITSHRSTSHHNSSQLITSQLITLPLLTPHLSHHNFSSQLITTYHIPTHHSSTSHTTSHTSLIASELITAPLLTPDITSPLLTPHFSHLPEVHIKLRYIKAWHVGLSGPFILHFWLGHVLCATKACAFSTSHLPKLLQRWSTLCVLTSKCASRRNSVHFFDSSTSKVAPRPSVFTTFWLRNVLRATTACNCSSFIWRHGSAPAALASLLFDPPEPQIIGKTQWFATCLPFRAPASSFFWLFLFSDLLASSHLAFPSIHIVGSLTSKLPSATLYYKAYTNHFPVLLCTKLAKKHCQYYFVLHKVLPSTSKHYFVLHNVSCSGFLPKPAPCNIHAAITLRFALSHGRPACIYAHGNRRWQQSRSQSTSVCNHRFQTTPLLRTPKRIQSSLRPPLHCGKEKTAERTEKQCFGLRTPPQNQPHATFMQPLPVVPARGGAKVALGLFFKTFCIYRTCIRLCATVMHYSKGPTWSSALHTALFTLQTSHFALTLHTYTSHSTLHLISSGPFSPHLSCSHPVSSFLIPSHLSSTFFSAIFISSEHCSTFLISSKLCSTHLSSSAHQKAFTVTEKPVAHKSGCAQKACAHRRMRHRCVYTEKPLDTESFCS